MFGEFLILLILGTAYIIDDIGANGKEDPLVRQESVQDKTQSAQEKKESIQKTIDTNTP